MRRRRRILRANALFLILFGGSGFLLDLRAFSTRPQSGLIRNAPHTVVGFVEAHGLAVIIGILLWRALPSRSWHLTAAAVHVLLGASNLIFWQIFVAANFSDDSAETAGENNTIPRARRNRVLRM